MDTIQRRSVGLLIVVLLGLVVLTYWKEKKPATLIEVQITLEQAGYTVTTRNDDSSGGFAVSRKPLTLEAMSNLNLGRPPGHPSFKGVVWIGPYQHRTSIIIPPDGARLLNSVFVFGDAVLLEEVVSAIPNTP